MIRHLPLALLLPAISTLVACGGAVSTPETSSGGAGSGQASSSSSSSSGGTTGSSGGSSTSSGGTTPLPQGSVDVCVDGAYRPLANVILEQAGAPGYLELRERYRTPEPAEARTIDKEGNACDGDDGPEGILCAQAVAAASNAGWPMEGAGMKLARDRFLVATRRNQVFTAGTRDEVLAFIGVGSAAQAAFHATFDGKYRIACDGAPNVAWTEAGYVVRAQSGFDCGPNTKVEEHHLLVAAGGVVTVQQTTLVKEGDPNCAIGRKPAGLVAREASRCADGLGRFFAEAAYLEAASVVSFDRLADELTSLGAPPSLVERARDSAADEVRHARTTSALARRFGGDVTMPEVAPARARSVFEIALENAVEGCVRETYGALVAHWQATHAGDLRIRAAMHVIAEDETRHAQLSVDVAAFLDGLLDDRERAAIDEARHTAIEGLLAELDAEPETSLVVAAGMPRASEAKRLLTLLDAAHLRAAA